MYCFVHLNMDGDLKTFKGSQLRRGISFPKQVGFYVSYIIPVIILVIFIQGYISKFL